MHSSLFATWKLISTEQFNQSRFTSERESEKSNSFQLTSKMSSELHSANDIGNEYMLNSHADRSESEP